MIVLVTVLTSVLLAFTWAIGFAAGRAFERVNGPDA